MTLKYNKKFGQSIETAFIVSTVEAVKMGFETGHGQS